MTKIKTDENKLVVDLTSKFMEGYVGWPRKLGRYSCSQLFKMLEAGNLPWGLPPSKYFEPEENTFEGAMRMSEGTRAHDFIQKFLDPSKVERKFEYYYYGPSDPRNGTTKVETEKGDPIFTLVGKVDYLPDDSVWEIKSSADVFTSAKNYQIHQAQLYCSVCERPKAYILQPLVEGNRLILKEIGQVDRDDVWFEGEMARLLNYHQRLELILEENNRKQNAPELNNPECE